MGAYYWFAYACEVSFREFCHNRTFGIDSYLSRRVRHGTLAGTLVAPIQERVTNFKERTNSVGSHSDSREIDAMMEQYRAAVDRIRDNLLHFRSQEKEEGLLQSGATSNNTRVLMERDFQVKMLGFLDQGRSSTELCPLFLEHCWNLLAGDLFRVRDELRNYFARVVRPLFRGTVRRLSHQEQWRPLLADLDRTAEELFSTVASWFSRSEGPAMIVTVNELVEVVSQEVKQYHPGYEGEYLIKGEGEDSLMGLAYQTAYDVLYICFSNVAEHADPEGVTEVDAQFLSVGGARASWFRLSVTSSHGGKTSDDAVQQASKAALARHKAKESMIREGNTGLAKAQALIEAYGPAGAFDWDVQEGRLKVEVMLPIIMV